MNKNLIKKILFWSWFCWNVNGCSVFEQQDQAGHRSKVRLQEKVIPKVEAYHPYGRRDYQIGKNKYRVLSTHIGYNKTGKASWYGSKFHGRQTATQEIYDLYRLTAASPELPLPCFVEVTNLKNGKTIIVRVNDRGPFLKGRLIDLSYAAAVALGFEEEGVTDVRVRGIDARVWSANQKGTQHSLLVHETKEKTFVNSETVAPSSKTEFSARVEERELVAPQQTQAKTVIKVDPAQQDLEAMQVGIFKIEKNANQLQQQLKTLFPEVQVNLEEVGESFRITMGPFASELMKKTVKMQLKELKLL